MHESTRASALKPIAAMLLSCLAVSFLFVWQGNAGFNLWDEGFLWYGVQRVQNNEVPIRDFMAYDPGRYYWSAALMSMFGDNGIMGVRASVAVVQALGLSIGLLLIARTTERRASLELLFLVLATVTLAIWMFPRHKLFDISISIFLTAALAYLVRKPTPWRYLVAGVAVGLSAVFGRNHGVYGVVGSLGVMVWLLVGSGTYTNSVRGALLWVGGVTIGFLPTILMLLLVPGFAPAFCESIRFLFQQNATNLPLAIPWPWTANISGGSAGESARSILVGLFFIALLAFGWLGAFWVLSQRFKRKPMQPALVSSVFLTIPYAHYAFSRADIGHLAQGVFPMLIGSFVLFSTLNDKLKLTLSTVLCGISLWIMAPQHPGWQCIVGGRCVKVEISGNELMMDKATADDVELLRHLAREYAPDGKSFVATPFWPGAYAVLNSKSPMWEIYALFPRQEQYERDEIKRISATSPGFVVVLDLPLDGREELRFRNTHPVTYKYIVDNYERIPSTTLPGYEIYRAKGASR